MLRPSEWGDDEAMALMFAPFEPREKAPAAYDRKMAFWMGAIRRRCQSKRSATFSVQRLAGEFERYGHTASCLPTVVEYMIRCGRLRVLYYECCTSCKLPPNVKSFSLITYTLPCKVLQVHIYIQL